MPNVGTPVIIALLGKHGVPHAVRTDGLIAALADVASRTSVEVVEAIIREFAEAMRAYESRLPRNVPGPPRS